MDNQRSSVETPTQSKECDHEKPAKLRSSRYNPFTPCGRTRVSFCGRPEEVRRQGAHLFAGS